MFHEQYHFHGDTCVCVVFVFGNEKKFEDEREKEKKKEKNIRAFSEEEKKRKQKEERGTALTHGPTSAGSPPRQPPAPCVVSFGGGMQLTSICGAIKTCGNAFLRCI